MYHNSGFKASSTINAVKRARLVALQKLKSEHKDATVGYCQGCGKYHPAPKKRTVEWRCKECKEKL